MKSAYHSRRRSVLRTFALQSFAFGAFPPALAVITPRGGRYLGAFVTFQLKLWNAMRFVPALAVIVTGLAAYLSRGVLDQIPAADGLMRVALLPPWQVLFGFTGMAALGLLLLDRRLPAVRPDTPAFAAMTLPALGLVALILPYLPFAADAFPPLQILAGPARAIVWLAIAAQIVWVIAQSPSTRAAWSRHVSPSRLAISVALGTLIVSGAAAARLTGTVLFPSGDEPHYLVMAQSLWRDGDLKIENNHQLGQYHEYFAPDLAPDFLARGKDGEIYSIHPVGMPVVMAPVYAAGGYRAVVAAMVSLAALAGAVMVLMVVRVTGSTSAAAFAGAAVTLTAPFLFNSFAVYPEIPAALAVILAYSRLIDPRATRASWLCVGLCAASLPWLSTKYAPMSAAIVALALARLVWPAERETTPADVRAAVRQALIPACAIVIPYALSLAGWFGFFYWIWGTPWPQAPYGTLVQTRPLNLTFGAPGLLFDQEYGLLPYAPVFALAGTGLWRMWRTGGSARRQAVEIVLIFAALLSTVGAFRIWWGGTASPGRPITSGLLLFGLPIAVAFRAAPSESARRAAQHLLLWLSIGVALVMLFAQGGFLIANGRDGSSSLLEYLSPRWPAWAAAPSFIYHEPLTAIAHTFAWIAIASVAALVVARLGRTWPGRSSLAAIAAAFAALGLGAAIVPHLPATPAWPGVDVRARPRTQLLDDFDSVARPVGIEYAPLRFVDARAVTQASALEVRPGTRAEAQPIRVLHNGRVSLPAGGYRLTIDWNGMRRGEKLSLQIGRTGDAWRTWDVEPRPGEQWATEFSLPVNAGFVGLRGTPELERTIGRITFAPVTIIDAGRRPHLPEVLGASAANGGDYFFFDENALPEAAGFWTRGARTARVAIHRTHPQGPLTLRLNSGLVANRLRIVLPGWSKTVVLEPKVPGKVEIPVDNRALVTFEFTADRAFVPREVDPASTDPRSLGIWIELVDP